MRRDDAQRLRGPEQGEEPLLLRPDGAVVGSGAADLGDAEDGDGDFRVLRGEGKDPLGDELGGSVSHGERGREVGDWGGGNGGRLDLVCRVAHYGGGGRDENYTRRVGTGKGEVDEMADALEVRVFVRLEREVEIIFPGVVDNDVGTFLQMDVVSV